MIEGILSVKKIAIIGTGVSGLAAAVSLAKHAGPEALTISLFESRHVAGGRTRSYLDPETGDVLDNGQHLMMGCYTSTLEYIDTIGTSELISRSKLRIPFAIYNRYTGSTRIATLKTYPFPSPVHAFTGLLKTDLLTAEEKYAAVGLARRVEKLIEDPKVAALTCKELFAKYHQPEGIVHKLWEPLVVATINASVADASAIAFLNVLKLTLLGRAQDTSLLYPNVGLSELLIDPAIDLLQRRGASVRFQSRISSIQCVDARYQIISNGQPVEELFDTVILATVPFEMELPIGVAFPRLEYSPIVNAYFWVDKPILHVPIQAFLNTTVQWAFNKPSIYAAERLALTVSAAGELSERANEEITSILWNDLRNTLPDARDAKLLRTQIIREKRATPLLTPTIFSGRPETTSAQNGLYFAGDFVQNGLPATIEGAVRNGHCAAQAALHGFAGMP